MIPSQDFKEFTKLLNSNNVRYLIVGGYAAAIHGHPRYTKNIDFWIDSTRENAIRLAAALDEFGFGSLGPRREDFLQPDQIIQLGYPADRIDLITSQEGLEFSECYKARLELEIDGISMKGIDLKSLKKIVGRYKDLADLENLK